ncbi:hypothetical protein HHK36_010092 [Tetracentron sinense]|uniref:Transcription repressor n=1 Tax=Tetracentron sinense TaxID=13715 RepID=A0A834ZDY2_TETSI|nr:hypothetical protein HHK36_010092 [Tetracentron sinense]
MAKRFKLRISRVLPSFQSCRSKDPSTFPENPIPALFRLSPVNPKAVDIDFRPSTTFRDPRPSKSHNSSLKRQVSSAIVSVGCGCRSRSGRQYITSDDDSDSPEYKWKKEQKWHVVARVQDEAPRRKIYNSSVSEDSDGDVYPPEPPPPSTEKKKKKQKNKKKSKPRVRISTSSADSGWFSSECGDEYDDEETETLVSSSRSFSTDSSWDFNPHLETIRETPMNRLRRKKKNLKKVKKVKRYASKSSEGAARAQIKPRPSPETETPARLSVLRRLIPCTVDGKVRESFAVVKKSEDPYEDFKRSMLEMILEKQMFEAKDLEQLLQCFLSLNSRHHHPVIVQAFSEIWEVLFCKSPMTHLVSKAL